MLIQGIFEFFGIAISKIFGNYENHVPTNKSLDELKEELISNLKNCLDKFNQDISKAINDLVSCTVSNIESSGFLTEIVTNPNYNGKHASKILKKFDK